LAILILLNNFLHDFSAAGWLFGSVVLWSILRNNAPDQSVGKQIADILKTILRLMQLSLGGIIVFGVIRALAYKQFEWNAAAGDSQVTLLIVKHVILTGVFVLGVVYYIKAGKFVRKAYDSLRQSA
jgi:uncharacterized membrane protein